MLEPVQWGGGWWRQAADGSWWYWNAAAFQWERFEAVPTKPSGPRAGFWARFGASLVDGMLLWIVMAALLWPLIGTELVDAFRTNDPVIVNQVLMEATASINLVGLVVPFAYRVWLEGGARGQTIGKRLFRIRVIGYRTGAPIGHGTAAIRIVCSWVSGLAIGIGYLAMLWNDERQTWHDRWSDTVVVPVSAYPVA